MRPHPFNLLLLSIMISWVMIRPPLESSRLVWDINASAFRSLDEVKPMAAHRFIKGPIPLQWLVKAAELPGKAPVVALVLWWIRGLCKSATFQLKSQATREFCVSRDAVYDALKGLERLGLISVVRHRGRSPVVTILEAQA